MAPPPTLPPPTPSPPSPPAATRLRTLLLVLTTGALVFGSTTPHLLALIGRLPPPSRLPLRADHAAHFAAHASLAALLWLPPRRAAAASAAAALAIEALQATPLAAGRAAAVDDVAAGVAGAAAGGAARALAARMCVA
jgi:hypothetical protein